MENEFGKAIAIMLVIITMMVLSFQHNNSVTGAAIGTTYGEIYGWIGFLFFVILSLLAAVNHICKR
jgi:hypothetical protein